MAGGAERAPPPLAAGEAAHDDETLERSLLEDVEELVADGKSYLQAELAFQKSRAAFISGGLRGVAILCAIAAVLALLAGIGLTVGLILALTPLITAWGATAVVVGLLLLIAFLLVRSAGKRWRRTMAVAGTSQS